MSKEQKCCLKVGQRENNEDVEKINDEYFRSKRGLKDQGFWVEGIFDGQTASATSVKRRQ